MFKLYRLKIRFTDAVPTLHSKVNTLSMFKNILSNEFFDRTKSKTIKFKKKQPKRDQHTEFEERQI